MIKLIAICMLMLSGCTCISYQARSELEQEVIEKYVSYCSTKDITGLRMNHGTTSVTLDNSNNDFGKVITDIAEKVPVSPL